MRRYSGNATAALLVAGMGLALGGCFQAAQVPEAPVAGVATRPDGAEPDPVRSRIVFTALQMVGAPYRYGGESPAGFDCSGLVQYAYRSAGVTVPRTSRDQLAATAPVPLADAGPGDLVFFRSKDYSHVGIYLGQGRFVHAPSTGRTVAIGSFNEAWYRSNFVRAGRVRAIPGMASTCGEQSAAAC
jgi:murein DD-endopeptidase